MRRTGTLLALVLILSTLSAGLAWGAPGDISTIAGTGTAGYNGEGTASSAQLNYPIGLAVSSTGVIYLADYHNHRVRKIENGVISTVAGTGSAGYNGEGTATTAQLYYPRHIALDTAGNLYIADYGNHRIRKIDTAGAITTIAGTGTAGFSGDGDLATSAKLYYPQGVAVAADGTVYISDTSNQRIRRIDPVSGDISTFAGTGVSGFFGDGEAATDAQLSYPLGLAVDAAGNLYIADSWNHRIRVVDTTGDIDTAAAIDATAVAVDSAGNLYVSGDHYVRVVPVGESPQIYAGDGTGGFDGDGGPATSASLNWPSGVAVDGHGNLYVADTDNHRIRLVQAADGDGDSFGDLVDNFPSVFSRCRTSQATIIGTPGADTINGTAGPDVVMGLGGADVINGFEGDDLICAGSGADRISGGLGKDKIYGEGGNDIIGGGVKSDWLYGGDGDDMINGGDGTRDRLYGGDGTDTLNGGAGGDDRCTLGETYAACEVIT